MVPTVIPPSLVDFDPPPRRRWRMPIGLRIFLVLLLIQTVIGACIVYRGYRQLAAIEQIRKCNFIVEVEPVGPLWLRQLLGEKQMEMFDWVVTVEFTGPQVHEGQPVWLPRELYREIGRWRHLKTLNFNGQELTDAEFEELRGLTQLQELRLMSSKISDASLVHIGRFKNLEFLFISDSQISDVGIAHLQQLPKLRDLDLSRTRITDDGLTSLWEFEDLELLMLDSTQVTDAGMVHLSKCRRLAYLYLRNTRLTDAGLPLLLGLESLDAIERYATRLPKLGIRELCGLRYLNTLDVRGTAVTERGVRSFETAYPNLSDRVRADFTFLTSEYDVRDGISNTGFYEAFWELMPKSPL